MLKTLRKLDGILLQQVMQWSGTRLGWREAALIATLVGAVALAGTVSDFYLHRRLVAVLLWPVALYLARASVRLKRVRRSEGP